MSSPPKPQLILQHLLDCGVLQANQVDEVLPMFSPDAASTVAVSLVSCFTENGSLPVLDTPFKIDWVIQVVAYCLTLPTIFNESLYSAITIFRHMLRSDNFFPDTQTWNTYARYIFRYISVIFEYKNDFSPNRIQLINSVFHDLSNFQEDLGSKFEDETWNVLVRMMIGTSNYLLSDSAKVFSDSNRNSMLSTAFSLTFDFLTNSHLTNPTIWSVFFKFCNSWSSDKIFLISWSEKVCKIYSKLLSLLFLPNLKKNPNSSPDELKLCGFQLHQFIHAINFNTVMSEQILFSELSKLVESLVDLSQSFINQSCETIDEMKDRIKRQKHNKPLKDSNGNIIPEKDQPLYKPLFPAEVFFGLFGHWCFKPFEQNELSQGHNTIIKTLMSIAGRWYLPPESKWIPVLLTTLLKTLQIAQNVNNDGLQFSCLKNGFHLFNRFPSNTIVDQFSKTINTFESSSQFSPEFWASYSVLLLEISEVRKIEDSVINHFQKKSTNYRAKLSVMELVLRQNFSLFKDIMIHDADIALSSYKEGQTLDKRIISEERFAFSDFLSSLCLSFAAAPAFYEIENEDDLLDKLLECVIENPSKTKFLNAFIILVFQICHWHASAFRPTFASKLLDFLRDSSAVPEKEIAFIVRAITGRPLDRSFQPICQKLGDFCLMPENSSSEPSELNETPVLSFMVKNNTIVTLVSKDGTTTREKSFVIHVRGVSGFSMWRIEDEIQPDRISIDKTPYNLPHPPVLPPPSVPDGEWDFENAPIIAKKIDKNDEELQSTIGPQFISPSQHYDHSYILIHALQKLEGLTDEQVKNHPLLHYSLRHKLIDFIVQTGLWLDIRKIDEDQASVLSSYDAIEPAYVLKIPIFRILYQSSQIFSRFHALLGAEHAFSFGTVPAVSFGSLTLAFSKNEDVNCENEDFVKILFSESPLELNLCHQDIPQAELLIVVQPIDQKFYKIECVCEDPLFWSTISQSRLVAAENISSTISFAIFTYVSLHKRDLFFIKEDEREKFLKNIKTTEITILDLVKDTTLSTLTPIDPVAK